MALPAGISICTVNVGAAGSMFGTHATVAVKVTPTPPAGPARLGASPQLTLEYVSGPGTAHPTATVAKGSSFLV